MITCRVLARDDTFLWLDSMDPTDEDLAVLHAAFDLHRSFRREDSL